MQISRLIVFLASLAFVSSIAQAQFLFTYEITDDDGRAPKSSLFDPSSYKIVTPSQLQSAYQKISRQLESQVTATVASVATPASVSQAASLPAFGIETQTSGPAPATSTGSPKETSSALSSLMDLFNFGIPRSSIPTSSAATQTLLDNNQPSIDQQAEARSLHEHWTQQQQQQQQQTSSDLSSPALQSFTTNTPVVNLIQQHQQSSRSNLEPKASYWLTANQDNAPDSNFLVEIERPQQQPEAKPIAPQADHRQSDSSLSFPNSNQTPQASLSHPVAGRDHNTNSLDNILSHSLTSALHITDETERYQNLSRYAQNSRESEFSDSTRLQLPANAPENFDPSSAMLPILRTHQQPSDQHTNPIHSHRARSKPNRVPSPIHLNSTEESLTASRQQQYQVQRVTKQQVFPEPTNRSPPSPISTATPSLAPPAESSNEIPKVSPQIYESFLLQQRDQQEKHMELLKAQQELNRLMEEKRKLDDAADKEAKRKAAREQELARKLKLEQELEAKRKREQEEAENRKRQAAEVMRRYRAHIERERKERERRDQEKRRERELAEQQQRRREMEEEELRLKMERDLEERRRIESERKVAEKVERTNRKRVEDSNQANYMYQQEELRKLIELKQKEDETQQTRRQLAGQQQQQTTRSPLSRADKLAQRHRERSQTFLARNSGAWGTPLRIRGGSASPSSFTTTTTAAPERLPEMDTSGVTAPQLSTNSVPVSVTTSSPPQTTRSRSELIAAAYRRLRSRTNDERLIKQKIPLYSGAGKYTLQRNETLSKDLETLLSSVTLPPTTTTSTSTPTTTSTTTTTTTQSPADSIPPNRESTGEPRFISGPVTPSNFVLDEALISNSLSPLLNQANSPSVEQPSEKQESNEPAPQDDVLRRPTRELTKVSNHFTATNTLASLQQTTRQTTTAFQRSPSQRSTQNETGSAIRTAHIGLASLPPDADNDGIPGRAGVEYPVLGTVPPTSFSCSKQPLNGYYADTETACQVVHLCQGGVQSSILCPNGTIFNQEKFSCQWWYEVNCSRAPIFYELNDNLYKVTDQSANELKRTSEN